MIMREKLSCGSLDVSAPPASRHALGLTALSRAPSAIVPPIHVECSSSEPFPPPRKIDCIGLSNV